MMSALPQRPRLSLRAIRHRDSGSPFWGMRLLAPDHLPPVITSPSSPTTAPPVLRGITVELTSMVRKARAAEGLKCSDAKRGPAGTGPLVIDYL
jgi:hypothetical protein